MELARALAVGGHCSGFKCTKYHVQQEGLSLEIATSTATWVCMRLDDRYARSCLLERNHYPFHAVRYIGK
eukprot:scaffold1127_cov160-Amphora_coffeaeformis.AAC.5